MLLVRDFLQLSFRGIGIYEINPENNKAALGRKGILV